MSEGKVSNIPEAEKSLPGDAESKERPVSFAGKISRRKFVAGAAAAAAAALAANRIASRAQEVEKEGIEAQALVLTPISPELRPAWLEKITLDKENNQGPVALHLMPDSKERLFYLGHTYDPDPEEGWQRQLRTVDFSPEGNSPTRDVGVDIEGVGPLFLDPENPYASVKFLPDGRCLALANLDSQVPQVGLFEIDMETNLAALIEPHNIGEARCGMTAMTLVEGQLHYVVKNESANTPELWRLNPDNTTKRLASMKGSARNVGGLCYVGNPPRVVLISRTDGSETLVVSSVDPFDPLNPSKNTQFYLEGVSLCSADSASTPLGPYTPEGKDKGAMVSLVLTNSAGGNPDLGNPAFVFFNPDGTPWGYSLQNVLCKRYYAGVPKDKATNCFPPLTGEQDKWGADVLTAGGEVLRARFNSFGSPVFLEQIAGNSVYPQQPGEAGPAPVRIPNSETGSTLSTTRDESGQPDTDLRYNRKASSPPPTPTLSPSPTATRITPTVQPSPTETATRPPVEPTPTAAETPVEPTPTAASTRTPAPTATKTMTPTPKPPGEGTPTPEEYLVFVPLVLVKSTITTAEGEVITVYKLQTSE